MAIYHAHPLLLFVSLFFVPGALGAAIEFSNCDIKKNDYSGVVNVTKVELIPYPIKFHDNPIFKITGVTSQNITGRTTYFSFSSTFRSSDGFIGVSGVDICDVARCPIEPGPFVLIANIYTLMRNDQLSGEIYVTLSIDNSMPFLGFHLDMCAEYKFHASALAKFVNIERPSGVNVSKVEIWPFNVTVNDNPVFRITAVTPKNISSSSTVSARMILEGRELFPTRRGYRLCDSSSHCPIEPGRFVLTFPHPYWRNKIKAGRYQVQVQIVNQKYPFQESMNLMFWFSVSEA